MKHISEYYGLMVGIILCLNLAACADHFTMPSQLPVTEGEEASISLKLTLDDTRAYTRGGEDTKIESLWVGIFNVNTKALTFQGEITGSDKFTGDEDQNVLYDLKGIKCKSGKSYIVAVANYKDVKAISIDNPEEEKDLPSLLESIKDWDDYRKIIFRRVSIGAGNDLSISLPNFGMPMSGCFRQFESDNSVSHDHNDIIDEVNILPGSNILNGAIHLRRILAHNTINISKTGDIINLEVIDIEIFNLPKYTWMHARTPESDFTPSRDNVIECANAGDAINIDGAPFNNPNYPTSLRYTPPSEIAINDGKYTFDFYQFENKRSGIITRADIAQIVNSNLTESQKNSELYALREREHKLEAEGTNSSIFKSLCSNIDGDLNNNATYVKIKAMVTYSDPGNNLDNPGGNYTDLGQQGEVETRMAEATYVVHLGHAVPAGITEEERPSRLELLNDFNCRRNANYTYNITVEKVNRIIVEAFEDGSEPQPGAEGIVTDVTEQMFDLDAHFGVFSIELSKEELESFTFSIRTYENGLAHDFFDHGAKGKNDFPETARKYYDWIELVPQPGDDLVSYPGYGNDRIYYLHQLKEYADRVPEGGSQKFTVYVNEYTYGERDPDGADYGREGIAWQSYVNQPSRQAWFNVSMAESADKESIYFKSKYALRQKSIQTYYEFGSGTICTTALGLEHQNESFGLNMRWTINTGLLDIDPDNGRHNVNDAVIKNSRDWSAYFDQQECQGINPISNFTQTAYADINRGENTFWLPRLILLNRNALSSGRPGLYDGQANTYDPQTNHTTAQYVEAIYACMNRNRDENGNGKIEASELKWYLPASGMYVRTILGRASLPSPLMDFLQTRLAAPATNGVNTLYHYISSDNVIMWLEEGMSRSSFYGQADQYAYAPWQIRCIRNLGTDLSSVSKEEKVEPAYLASGKTGNHPDEYYFDSTTKGGIVVPLHYYGTALREPTLAPLPLHKSNAHENKIARYGFEYTPSGNVFNSDGSFSAEAETESSWRSYFLDRTYQGTTLTGYKTAAENALPCESLNETSGRKGWRIPNQKELVIMRRAGAFNKEETKDKNDQTVYLSSDYAWMGATQEYWSNDNYATSVGTDESAHRMVTVRYTLATAQTLDRLLYVRCVRDLTADEVNKSYSQIIGNDTR